MWTQPKNQKYTNKRNELSDFHFTLVYLCTIVKLYTVKKILLVLLKVSNLVALKF